MIIWDKEVKEKIGGLHLTLGIIKNVKVASSTDKNKEIYNRAVSMIKEKFNLENLKTTILSVHIVTSTGIISK